MGYKLELAGKPPYIRINYLGIVTPEELLGAAKEGIELMRREKVYLVLADCSKMTGGHSLISLYQVAVFLEQNKVPNTLFREALILPGPAGLVETARFYEDTAFNRGYSVRLFPGEAEALDWLLK